MGGGVKTSPLTPLLRGEGNLTPACSTGIFIADLRLVRPDIYRDENSRKTFVLQQARRE